MADAAPAPTPTPTPTATAAPAPPPATTVQELPTPAQKRRDMQSMLTFIQGARLVSMAHETAVSQVQGWLLGRFWFSLLTTSLAIGAIVVGSWLLRHWHLPGGDHASFFCGIVLLLFVARVGALISIGRRLKADDVGAAVGADAIYALATLGSGRNGLAIALMSSNAFGLIMYALFASGLPAALGLSGGIAPSFRPSIDDLRRQMVDDRTTAASAAAALKACLADPPQSAVADDAAGDAIAGTGGNVADIDTNTTDPDANAGDASDIAGNAGDTAGNAGAAPAAGPPCEAEQATVDAADAAVEVSQSALLLASRSGVPLARDNGSPEPILGALKTALGLTEVSDLFKMLIWAFIAGFFEQLVPDMLNTLAARGRAGKDKEKK